MDASLMKGIAFESENTLSNDVPDNDLVKKSIISGNKTIKAAPANDPNIEPNPPMITINKTIKDFCILKASVGSTAPKYTEKNKAQATPT